MKKPVLLFSIILSLAVGCLVVGCNPKEPKEEELKAPPVVYQSPPPEGEDNIPIVGSSPEDDDIPIVGAAPSEPGIDPEQYNVDLDVVPDMKKDKEYLMQVKVVLPKYETEPSPGMVRGSKVLYAEAVNYVHVTPIAPGFDIDPAESKIIEFDPTGTEVQFKITPREKGPKMISAEVELLENADGSGDVKSKSSGQVSVIVKVDGWGIIEGGLKDLFGVVWKIFKNYWPAFVTLVFGALLFVARKYIKKKTGYGGDGESEESVAEESENADE
ncbi:MAG: hypothetical protein J6Y61_06065 [Bacteroidales bacterium]|nr:hypothetical protein [Bacteroidales bacterium]